MQDVMHRFADRGIRASVEPCRPSPAADQPRRDGRTYGRCANSIEEARLAGLQYPNCWHSVSAYTPGLTVAKLAESAPAGCLTGQRQRGLEPHIRKYRRCEAATVTPEAKRAASDKVRQWQAAPYGRSWPRGVAFVITGALLAL
ncbi:MULTISPECIES: phage minor capsid protein [Streptomyces violaceusniger group]|uniref:Uncharacterized protein n=1 Tax=Streptomyces javensis TaxID=114698 RepID=A0ABN1WU64_9ACTN